MPASRTQASHGWLGDLSRRDWLIAAALAALVAVFYLPATRAGFVWDDSVFVQEPDLQKSSGLRSVWLTPSDLNGEAHYWPVTYTTLWFEHQLWGLNPLGYHIDNMVLHLVNSLLVWRLMIRLRVPAAAVIGALFAVHPLHVESVAWIIERKDVLSGLLYLSAVLSWIRFVEAPKPHRYALTMVLYTAGLLAKSVVVTLPAALLIWQWYARERITRDDLARLAPFFAVGAAITLADLSFYSGREPLSLGYSALERLMIAARALWFYVGKLLWPANLKVIYPHWDVSATSLANWAFVAATLALATTLWLARHRIGRGPLAGLAFFAVTLSPTLGLIDYGYMQFSFVAERFQYLAGIGLIAVVVGAAAHGLARLAQRARSATASEASVAPTADNGAGRAAESAGRTVGAAATDAPAAAETADARARARRPGTAVIMTTAWAVTAVAVLLLGVLTWRQASVYESQVTLFTHVIEHNPQARLAHANLGAGYLEAERYEEAIEVSKVALERHPEEIGLHSNIGLGYLELGDFELAEKYIRSALELEPDNAETHFKLGNVLRGAKRHDEAVEQYRAALELNNELSAAHAGLGVSLYHLERYSEALEALTTALGLAPEIHQAAEAHRYSGLSARALGNLEAAVRHHAKALEFDPDNSSIALEMSTMLLVLGRDEEAAAYRARAGVSDVADDDTERLFGLAERLRSNDQHDRAILSYEAVLERDPEHARAQAGFGESLYRVGRDDEAIATMSRALDLGVDADTARSLHFLIAEAAKRAAQSEVAARHLETALEADPEFVEALDSLGRLRFEQTDYVEALRLFEALAELRPDAASFTNLGVTSFLMGDSETALTHLDRALEFDADNETALANRSEVLRSIQDAQRSE